MKKVKYLLLAALLFTASSCSSKNAGFEKVGASEPLSFYEKMSYEPDTDCPKSYSSFIYTNFNEDSERLTNGLYFTPGSEEDDYDLYSLRTDKVICNNIADGFTNQADDTDHFFGPSRQFFEIKSRLVMYTTFKDDTYTLHALQNDAEELFTYTSKEKFEVYGEENGDLFRVIIASEGRSYEKDYLCGEYYTLSEVSYFYDGTIGTDYDTEYFYITSSYTSTIIYDRNEKYIGTLNINIDDIASDEDYTMVQMSSSVFSFYKTESYYSSVIDKSSKDTFKTSCYRIDFSSATLEYASSLPYVIENYSYNEETNCSYITYRALNEKGETEPVLYGTLFSNGKGNFDKKYVADNLLLQSITKIGKGKYIVYSYQDTLNYYVDKNTTIFIDGVDDVIISKKNIALCKDDEVLVIPFEKFTETITSDDYQDGFVKGDASYYIYNDDLIYYTIDEDENLCFANYGIIDENFSSNAEYDAMIINSESIKTLDGKVVYKAEENSEITSVDYIDSVHHDENSYTYLYSAYLLNNDDNTTSVMYFFIDEIY